MMFIKSSTGDSLREIEEEWDFPHAERWIDYCAEHPPLQMMVAAYLGMGSKGPRPIKVTEENFGDFMQMIGIGGGRVLDG